MYIIDQLQTKKGAETRHAYTTEKGGFFIRATSGFLFRLIQVCKEY